MFEQGHEKTFSIVEFTIDNSVEIVPSSWISENQQECKFPCPIPKGFLKVQSNIDSPTEENWTDYKISFVKRYGKSDFYIKILTINIFPLLKFPIKFST